MIRKLWNVIRYSFRSKEQKVVLYKVSKDEAQAEAKRRNREVPAGKPVVYYPSETDTKAAEDDLYQ